MNKKQNIIMNNTYENIHNCFANNLLHCIEEYNVPLDLNTAFKVVEYEQTLQQLINLKNIQLNKNGLIRILDPTEKEEIKYKIKNELNCLEKIKNILYKKNKEENF